jgi:ankyrin repeat protein
MFASGFDCGKAVSKLIERGANVEALSQFGCTALHWAADNGSESACEILLNHGARVNAKNKSGNTPLNGAARQAHVKVVKLLLKYQAETKIKNKYGETPLKKAQPSCAILIQTHEATLEARISKIFRNKPKKFIGKDKSLRTEKNYKL